MRDLFHFDDLTKINVPFGLLDGDTRKRLIAHEGEVEIFGGVRGRWSGFDGDWESMMVSTAFRAKPTALTKPSVNWSHVHSRWKWLARDDCGMVCLFKSRPEVDDSCWCALDREFAEEVHLLASLDPGTCDWKDSLVQRPKGEAV